MLDDKAGVNGVKIGKVAYIIDQNVIQNTKKGSLVATNVVHHEGIHMLLDGVPANEKAKLRKEIENSLKNSKDPDIKLTYNLLNTG